MGPIGCRIVRDAMFALVLLGLLAAEASAGVYNLHLVTDKTPDYTDIESLARSTTDAWTTPQDKSIAVWRWGRRSRRQTSCAIENGRHIIDPVLHYNSYGAMNCGIISALNIASWREIGYRGRYIQLGDHTVSEVSWDDGKTWHLFDSSMSVFCFNHDGVVASCDEIKSAAGCELSGGKSEPGHYYFYHVAPQCGSHLGPQGWRAAADQPVLYKRTLGEGASSYTDGFSVDKYCQMVRSNHRYTLNLRPGETYTRYWSPLEQMPAEQDKDLAYFRPMANGSDPNDQHNLHNIRGNGRWVLAPDLTSPQARLSFYEDANIALQAEDGAGPKVHPAQPGQPASVVFKVYAANVITAMRLQANGVRKAPEDRFKISVSRDAGLHWTGVWESAQPGEQAINLALREPAAGVTQCLVRFEIEGAKDRASVGIESLRITTITQLNRRTLPALGLGSNEVALKADEQVETAEIWPALHDGKYKETVFAEDNIHSEKQPDGMYKATLGAGVNGRECSATWRLAVPSDITGVTIGAISTARSSQAWVSLRHSWDGEKFEQFHLKNTGEFPVDEQVRHTISGAGVPAHARQAYVRGVFFCKNGAATYNLPGLQDLILRVNHKPRSSAMEPIEVTYCWTEHRESGEVTRTHTELVRTLPHRYAINVAGRRDPTMQWVRINLQRAAEKGAAKYGYSDGQDVGAAFEREKVAYRWGKIVSVDKPYSASRPSSASAGNPDTDGKELTNGIVIAPTDYATSKVVQPATALWEGGDPVTFVLDLEKPAMVAGLRACTHQPNAKFVHPASIEVSLSEDQKQWTSVGTIRHDDLFRPPGDYEAWEHDDDPAYRDLPAQGRLAYAYPLVLEKPVSVRYVRLVCTPQAGRGMGLSEFSVHGTVEKVAWPKREVVHR